MGGKFLGLRTIWALQAVDGGGKPRTRRGRLDKRLVLVYSLKTKGIRDTRLAPLGLSDYSDNLPTLWLDRVGYFFTRYYSVCGRGAERFV